MIARVYVCETCGSEFTPARRDARHCGSACKQKAYRDRQRRFELDEIVWKLLAAGEIDGPDALLLLVAPPTRVLERLGAA